MIIDEKASIPPAFFNEHSKADSNREFAEQINLFIDKYKGILTAIVSIAMLALIIYLIVNMEFIKMNPLQYCEKALNNTMCFCINKTLG